MCLRTVQSVSIFPREGRSPTTDTQWCAGVLENTTLTNLIPEPPTFCIIVVLYKSSFHCTFYNLTGEIQDQLQLTSGVAISNAQLNFCLVHREFLSVDSTQVEHSKDNNLG